MLCRASFAFGQENSKTSEAPALSSATSREGNTPVAKTEITTTSTDTAYKDTNRASGKENPESSKITKENSSKDPKEGINTEGEKALLPENENNLPPVTPQTKNNSVHPEVDQSTGSLSYSYQINVPAGRNGMTPDLSLKYNSRNASKPDSYLGLGWDISIPYIVREPIKRTNNLYNEAFFSSSLSGNLIATTNTDSFQYTIYRPETDNGEYLKYTYNSDNTWSTKTKDGKLYIFGETSASRQDDPNDSTKVYKWMLAKIIDQHGNEIRYSYIKNAGQIYPSQILYTYHASSPAINTINFTYINPADYGSTVYNSGFPVTTYKILDKITAITIAENITYTHTYTFYYGNAQFLKQKLLNIVDHDYTQSGTTTPNIADTTEFEYSTKLPGWEIGTHSLESIDDFLEDHYDDTWYTKNIHTYDFDKNGFEDLLIVYREDEENFPKLMLNNGTTFEDKTMEWNIPNTFHSREIAIVDLNGDHFPDIYTQSQNLPKYINTGSGFVADNSGIWHMPNYVSEAGTCEAPNADEVFDSQTFLYDINKDGKNDIVYFGGSNNFKVALNNGAGWTISNDYTFVAQNDPIDNWENCSNDTNWQMLMDFNGDGLEDFVRKGHVYLNTGLGFEYNENYTPTFFNDRRGYGDLNGDGLVDYIWRKNNYNPDNICRLAFLNTGSGFDMVNPLNEDTENCPNTGKWDPYYIRYNLESPRRGSLLDVTADGYPDIVGEKNSGSYSETIGKIRGINDGKNAWGSGGEDLDDWNQFVHPVSAIYKDFNNDGVLDYMTPKISYGGIGRIMMGKAKVPNVLTKIKSQQGAETQIEYDASPTNLNDTNSSIMPVVKKITTNNIGFNQPDMVTQYEYEDGEYIIDDITKQKRFAGFHKVTVTESGIDLSPIKITETYFHQNNGSDSNTYEPTDNNLSLIGKPYYTITKNSSETLKKETWNKYNTHTLVTEPNTGRLSKFIFPTEVTTKNTDENATIGTAEIYTFNTSIGEQTKIQNMGLVNVSTNGTFSNVGTDESTTNYTYATNSDGITKVATEITTDHLGVRVRETRHHYDSLPFGSIALGNETKIEQWKSGLSYINTQKTYDSVYGLVTSSKDPLGNTTTYTYDTYKLYPSAVTNPLGQTISYVYDYSAGKANQITDQNNFIYQNKYDGLGRILEEKVPDSVAPYSPVLKNKYVYGYSYGFPRITKTTYLNATSNFLTYQYFDGLERLIQERQRTGVSNYANVRDLSYNNLGFLEKESLKYQSYGTALSTPTTNTTLYTHYVYDEMGRMLSSSNNVGTTGYEYTGLKTSITDANGNTKNFYKDAYSNLIKVEEINDISTYTTEYFWNLNKNLIKIIDAGDNIRVFGYDGLGRRTKAQDLHVPTDTTFGIWIYTYNDAGNLIKTVSPNGQIVNYAYDMLSRPVTEDATSSTGTDISYTYDSCTRGIGKLCNASVLGSSNTSYVYNSLGNIESETKTINGASYNTSYTYDRQNNVTLVTYPDLSQVRYTFNSGGFLKKIEQKENNGTFVNIISNFDYNPMGQITTQVYANGVTTTNTYDPTKLYRLTRKLSINTAGLKLQDLNYIYDAVGNITQTIDASQTNSAKTSNYVYDDLYRLTSATITNSANNQNYTQAFTYDPVGNILTGPEGAYQYLGHNGSNYANPHAVTSIGGSSITYDKNGNMIKKLGTLHVWNYKDQLVRVQMSLTGTSIISNFYDHTGARVRYQAGTNTTIYPNKFYNTNGTKNTKQIYAGSQLVATVETTNNVTTPYYVHTDNILGSNVISNNSGVKEQLLDYFPFGDIRLNEQSSSFNEQRKFGGHYYDTETELIYMGARYYNGKGGRFLSQDPMFWTPEKLLENPQSMNSYSYALNNPITNIDPDGREAKSTIKKFWNSVKKVLGINKANTTQADTVSKKEISVLNSPVGNAPVSSSFQKDRSDCPICSKTHGGTDYQVGVGTPVQATADGVTKRADWSNTLGNTVIIEHIKLSSENNGVYTLYGHGSSIETKVGQVVKTGDVIMYSGNTGANTTGPHLHHEVIKSPFEFGSSDFYYKDKLQYRYSPNDLSGFLQ